MRQFSVSASNVINRVSIKSLIEKQIVKTVECSFFSISAIPVKTVTDRVVGSTVMTSYQLKCLPWGKCPIESVAMSKQCLCEPGLTWEVGSAGSDVILGRGELRPHLTVITLSHVPPHHTPLLHYRAQAIMRSSLLLTRLLQLNVGIQLGEKRQPLTTQHPQLKECRTSMH